MRNWPLQANQGADTCVSAEIGEALFRLGVPARPSASPRVIDNLRRRPLLTPTEKANWWHPMRCLAPPAAGAQSRFRPERSREGSTLAASFSVGLRRHTAAWRTRRPLRRTPAIAGPPLHIAPIAAPPSVSFTSARRSHSGHMRAQYPCPGHVTSSVADDAAASDRPPRINGPRTRAGPAAAAHVDFLAEPLAATA